MALHSPLFSGWKPKNEKARERCILADTLAGLAEIYMKSIPNRASRNKRRHAPKRAKIRASFPRRTARRQMWTYTTKSEREARAVSLYLRYVLGIPHKVFVGTVFTNSGGDGLPTWEIQARTLRALVEEAIVFAADAQARGLKVHILDGQLCTVQNFPHHKAAPDAPPKKRLSDYMVPSGTLCGQPYYSMPSPEEAERIVKEMKGEN